MWPMCCFIKIAYYLSQDPAMSSMLESFSNPTNKDQLEERMARIKEDPSLKHILEEIETGGPTAMMRSEEKMLLYFVSRVFRN